MAFRHQRILRLAAASFKPQFRFIRGQAARKTNRASRPKGLRRETSRGPRPTPRSCARPGASAAGMFGSSMKPTAFRTERFRARRPEQFEDLPPVESARNIFAAYWAVNPFSSRDGGNLAGFLRHGDASAGCAIQGARIVVAGTHRGVDRRRRPSEPILIPRLSADIPARRGWPDRPRRRLEMRKARRRFAHRRLQAAWAL